MRGTLHPADRNVTIIGGGIAGLMMAEALLRAGCRVSLYEASGRLGGMIATRATPWGLAEQAAHSFRTGAAMLELCTRLNIPLAEARTRRKLIYRHGRMSGMPLRFLELLVLIGRSLYARGRPPATLESWARHHCGPAALEALFTPLARGIYGAEPAELWQPLAFPGLNVQPAKPLWWSWLGRSRAAGPKPRMAAPLGGMEALVKELVNYVGNHPQARVYLQKRMSRLPKARNLILAVPSAEKSRLLKMVAPQTAEAFARVKPLPLVAITAFLSGKEFPEAMGVLAAKDEPLGASGVLFNSQALPGRVTEAAAEKGIASFTFMYGGRLGQMALGWHEDQIRQQVQNDAVLLFGEGVQIEAVSPAFWKQALPCYNQDLNAALEMAVREWCAKPGRILAGNDTGEISLRGLAEDAATLARMYQATE